MRLWFLAALGVGLVYQTVALTAYEFRGVGPDFVLLLVCYLGLHETPRRSLILAGSVGFLVDALSLDPWGVHALGYAGGVGVLTIAQRTGWSVDPLPRVLVTPLAVAVAGALRLAIVWEPGDPAANGQLFRAAGCAAYSALLSPAVFGLLDPFRGRLVTPVYRRLR